MQYEGESKENQSNNEIKKQTKPKRSLVERREIKKLKLKIKKLKTKYEK